MNLLAIETATNACSVALGSGEGVTERYRVGTNLHSQVLLDMVSEVLTEASVSIPKLSAIAVGQGPGSFTGLRIGIGVAQGLAYGAGCKMIGVSSLMALAQQAIEDNPALISEASVLTGIDARMNEIYCAEYTNRDGSPELRGQMMVLPPEKISANDPDVLVGNAWQIYQSRLNPHLVEKVGAMRDLDYPRASAVLTIAQRKFLEGDLIDPREFRPDYIRDDVAKKSVKPQIPLSDTEERAS